MFTGKRAVSFFLFLWWAIAGNAFAFEKDYRIFDGADIVSTKTGEVACSFSVPGNGVYNLWVPTFTRSYPVNNFQFPDILRKDFPYSFKIDSGIYQAAVPHFPKLRGKFWHAWTRLAQVPLTAGEHKLFFQLNSGGPKEAIPAGLFVTATDYAPPDSVKGNTDDLWLEAEDAFEHNFVASANKYSSVSAPDGILKDPTKFGRGGGKVLRLNIDKKPGEKGYYARYRLEIKSDGPYDIWYHGYAPNGKGWWSSANHSPFTWVIDNGNKNDWFPEAPEGRPLIYSHQSYGWYLLGSADLKKGEHILEIKIDKEVCNAAAMGIPGIYEQMLDAFFFVKNGRGSDQTVPCDITASSRYLARTSGLDETNVFYPEEKRTVKIALDRCIQNSETEESFEVKYKVTDYYGKVTSGEGKMQFQPGSITASIALPLFTRPGLYQVTAQFYQNNKEVAYLDSSFGVIFKTRFPGPKEDSIFGAAQDAVLYEHLKKAGVKWVRAYRADWPVVEPKPGEYHWEDVDREIANLKKNEMNIILCFEHSAPWASSAPAEITDVNLRVIYPPKIEPWKEFTKQLVTRYKNDVKYFELWNEPWIQGYAWKAGSEEYAELTKATYEALKEADPQALLGAYEWPHGLFQRGAGKYFDAVVIHPYSDIPEKGFLDWLSSWCPPAQKQNKKIWATEQVVGMGRQYSNPRQWADFVVRSYVLAMAWGVDQYCYFDFDDWCLGEAGGGSGLINPDATPRPGYIAHAIMAYFMEDTKFIRKIGREKDVWVYLFRDKKGPAGTAVLWTTGAKPKEVFLDAKKGFQALDIMGNETGGIKEDKCALTLSESPVYLRADSFEELEASLKPVFEPPARKDLIDKYLMIGPFDNPRYDNLRYGFFIDYPPEREVDENKAYPGLNGRSVRWRKVRVDREGVLDFAGNDNFGPMVNALAYAAAWVYAPEKRQTELTVGSDDGVAIWLNGGRIFSILTERGVFAGQDDIYKDYVPITLNQGWNQLLFKVEQAIGGWGLYVKVVDPAGDLKFTASPGKTKLPPGEFDKMAERTIVLEAEQTQIPKGVEIKSEPDASGGKYLNLVQMFDKDKSYKLDYSFTVDFSGRYSVWVASSPNDSNFYSPFTWKIDNGGPQLVQDIPAVSQYCGGRLGWVKLGNPELNSGKHVIRFEISRIRPFDSSLIFPEDRNVVFFLDKIVVTPDEDFIP